MAGSGVAQSSIAVDPHEAAESLIAKFVHDPQSPQPGEVANLAEELLARLRELDDENQHLREVQRQLEDYRDRYIDLYDFAPVGYASLDHEGYIQEINLAGAQLLGTSRSELTGYRFVDFIAPEDVAIFEEHLQSCVEQRCAGTSELRIVSKDFGVRTVQMHSVPIEDAAHELLLCKTALTDITERKRGEDALRESEIRHRAILNASLDGIITIDERGIIESVNPATERLFGYAAGELIGGTVNVLMPSPHREKHDSYIQHYVRTGEKKIIGIGREVTGQRKDGTLFPMDLSISELFVNGQRMFMGLVHDVSERKAKGT